MSFISVNKSPAASQAEVEAGTETALREFSPIRVAQAIAALGGGGTSTELDGAAWVEADGDDGTASLGNPASPYLTMSAAYDAGARTFFIGTGTFAGLTKTGAIDINILGLGQTRTTITLIASSNSGTVTVRDLGMHTCTITTVGIDGASDTNSSNINLYNCNVGTVQQNGGIGSIGIDQQSNNGMQSGDLVLERCVVAAVYHNGGNGGDGTGFGGGNGGPSATIYAANSTIVDIFASGGNGGSEGGASLGGNGLGGSYLTLINSRITGSVTASGGSGGSGGGGNGSSGDSGAITASSAYYSIYGGISIDGGMQASISGKFVFIDTINAGSPTINALLSYINGAAY